jgi:hypothetical protein
VKKKKSFTGAEAERGEGVTVVLRYVLRGRQMWYYLKTIDVPLK